MRADIRDGAAMLDADARSTAIDAVVHFAAETHVDRSIVGQEPFLRHQRPRHACGSSRPRAPPGVRRFLQVSTDEVYGSLGPTGAFDEDDADRAAQPVLRQQGGGRPLRAWRTPHARHADTVITRCSNNYGPYQFPEKLIPL